MERKGVLATDAWFELLCNEKFFVVIKFRYTRCTIHRLDDQNRRRARLVRISYTVNLYREIVIHKDREHCSGPVLRGSSRRLKIAEVVFSEERLHGHVHAAYKLIKAKNR